MREEGCWSGDGKGFRPKKIRLDRQSGSGDVGVTTTPISYGSDSDGPRR